MAKGVCEINYLRAIQIMYGEWHSINPCDYCDEETNDCTVESERISSEDIVIKKESWENLSDEAKEVINTILYAPAEILEVLKTPKRKLLTKKSVQKYFRKVWYSNFITDIIIEEITQWAKQL